MQSSIISYATSDKLPMFRRLRHPKQNQKPNIVEYKLPARDSHIHKSQYLKSEAMQQTLDKLLNSSRKRKFSTSDEEDLFNDDDFLQEFVKEHVQ